MILVLVWQEPMVVSDYDESLSACILNFVCCGSGKFWCWHCCMHLLLVNGC